MPDADTTVPAPVGHESVTDLDNPGPYGAHANASPLGARNDHPAEIAEDADDDDD